MKPFRTVAYFHEKILFQASDMLLAEKFMTSSIQRPWFSQEHGLGLFDCGMSAGRQNPKHRVDPR